MSYVIPFNLNKHAHIAHFGFRKDAKVVTRKKHPVKVAWTLDGFQGFVQLKQSQMYLVWNKNGECISFNNSVVNKDYDLFYEVEETKPGPEQKSLFDACFNCLGVEKSDPLKQVVLDASVYCDLVIKMTCQTEEVIQFNLDKYMAGGYELETRNGFKVSALEFTGDERKVFRGADNMKHLRWTKTGKINANGIGHELDLMMRKVKDK